MDIISCTDFKKVYYINIVSSDPQVRHEYFQLFTDKIIEISRNLKSLQGKEMSHG